MVLDMDRFNYVNDSLGYFVGDRLLEAVAVRLKDCLRESDSVARGGGDEFVIVVPGVSEREEIDLVAKKVLGVIAEPFQVECHEVRITGSMGISQFPKDGEIPEKLLQEADAAMFNSKKRGRGCYTFCSPAMTEASRRQQRLEADLVQACSRDEFVLHYQPFVESESGRITGMEALLRWKHPGHGLISPNQFIPYLEEMGMMVEVGRWAMRSACRQNVEWQRQGFPAIRIAVNVSSQQLYQGNIVDTVEAVLREDGLDSQLLELELTESRVLDNSEGTISIMRRLKQIGVSLSLDDFGTGWSSLSYLRSFPLDRIKIDRSFVRDIATEPTARAMVKSILGLGQSLSVACIAEGVETPQQRDFLRNQKCPEMQGFYFSRPLAAVDATALLRAATVDARGFSGKWGTKAAAGNAVPSAASSIQPAFQLSE
jgi:diguanylate cyclase (GGDEF)-like protein